RQRSPLRLRRGGVQRLRRGCTEMTALQSPGDGTLLEQQACKALQVETVSAGLTLAAVDQQARAAQAPASVVLLALRPAGAFGALLRRQEEDRFAACSRLLAECHRVT